VSDYERERVLDWLRRLRGPESQERFAAAVSAQTGWHVTRDRYSKYESGALPFGRTVLGHFLDYAESLGVEGPDMTPPAPQLSLEERAVIAAERTALATERYANAVELHVLLLSRQVVAAEAIAARQGAAPSAPEMEQAVEAIRAWGQSALADSRSLAPLPGPLPAGEG
jgi:hypothetical protein